MNEINLLRNQIEALTAERDALKDAARLALDALLAEVRTTANQITYTNLLTVIAALKAVL